MLSVTRLPIAADKVRYIGDGLAAVFAETSEAAEAALEKIKVVYDELPAVFSVEEAAQPDAPKVHEQGNLLHRAEIFRGDVDQAFSQCAVIIEDTYYTPIIEHAFLEPECGVAFVTEDGGVTVQVPTQTSFDDRAQLSEILDMPPEKIRVVQLPQGGSFGGKEDMILQQYLALGTLLTRRPVKMVLSREESLRVHVKRHSAKMHYKTGCDSDGNLLAVQSEIHLDTGCYASLRGGCAGEYGGFWCRPLFCSQSQTARMGVVYQQRAGGSYARLRRQPGGGGDGTAGGSYGTGYRHGSV